MKKILLSLFLIYNGFVVSQELPKIVPLSPNAAAIAKYGEIPVGHFTGTPNINIPIYEIKSGSLTLPLSLSYHAGGNRVEDIASWVGLGWSLGTIPIISRSVRGLPDEMGGYFTNPLLENLYHNKSNTTQYAIMLNLLNTGEYDSEPDIFSYTINGESGKFFYNQELGEFVTTPVSNIKIIKEGTSSLKFKIISQEGIEYEFGYDGIEKSGQVGYLLDNPPPVTTSWRITKIKPPSGKDSITFNYDFERHSQKFLTSKTRYQWIGGEAVDTDFLTSGPNSLINENETRRLTSINFKNGYIEFIKNNIERKDLQGGHSLKEIIIKNNENEQINKFDFEYKYIRRGGGSEVDEYSIHWLMLEKFNNISNSNKKLTHSFKYNENFPRSRTSFAQDYWGYYNGQSQNQNLIPPISIPNSGTQIPGANRLVNPSYSQFGILEKIIYPTKGYTEFKYENHEAVDIFGVLPKTYIKGYAFIETDYYGQANWPTTNYYEEPFTLNNPPDEFLNNDNVNGGAYVVFEIESPGCELTNEANECAIFRVIGTSVNNSHVNYDIWGTGRTFHLPNGNYKITARFNQSPPQYHEFSFTATWDEIDPTSSNNNKYVGGLRVNEIRSYPNNLPTTNPIVKKYKYVLLDDIDDYTDSDLQSSGLLFHPPELNFSDEVTIYEYVVTSNSSSFLKSGRYLRLRGHNNVQQISHSGSYVGYKTVTEETNNIDETGVTIYNYIDAEDEPYSEGFPFAPAASNEVYRGHLYKAEYYRKDGNQLSLAKLIRNEYVPVIDKSTYNPFISSFALKTGKNHLIPAGLSSIYFHLAQEESEPDAIVEYELTTEWTNISKTIEEEYYGTEAIRKTTNYFYDNSNHLLRTRTETTDSNGKTISTKIKYPQDITSPTPAITELINQNRLAEPIETETINNGQAQKQFTDYKDWGNDLVLPEFIKTSKGTNSLENRIVYHAYDDKGNPVEVSKADGTHIYYIWGYDGQYPIAKLENFESSDITTTVQTLIDAAVNASDLDTNATTENSLRTALNALRNSSALSNAHVSTYTYDPLIGVTSMTDPKGYTMYYEYDDFNRLKEVKDAQGNIISKNEYHYKGQ